MRQNSVLYSAKLNMLRNGQKLCSGYLVIDRETLLLVEQFLM